MKTLGQRLSHMWQRLQWRLFASHLAVALVAVTVLCWAVEVIATGYVIYGVGPRISVQTPLWSIPIIHIAAKEAQRLNTTLAIALFVGGWGALVAAMATTLFVSRRIVTPLRALMAATGRIAAGKYGERVRVTDNHEIHQLAESFNQMASTLEQTEARRQALIADVRHELRTPLTSIKGYMEGLIDGIIPATPENYRLIYGEADRLERLVQDLQELSRLEAGQARLHRRDFGVAALLNTIVGELRPAFDRKGVALHAELPPPTVWINADSDRIKQVVLNLLTNALRYTPAGGSVRLSARDEADGLAIAVRDTGVGIAAEHVHHIFDRFYRVDKSRSRSGGGTGIGLTIARYLMEAHGGTIGVSSTPGGGTTFTLNLPASALRVHHLAPAESASTVAASL